MLSIARLNVVAGSSKLAISKFPFTLVSSSLSWIFFILSEFLRVEKVVLTATLVSTFESDVTGTSIFIAFINCRRLKGAMFSCPARFGLLRICEPLTEPCTSSPIPWMDRLSRLSVSLAMFTAALVSKSTSAKPSGICFPSRVALATSGSILITPSVLFISASAVSFVSGTFVGS